jgi:hypothetical protein
MRYEHTQVSYAMLALQLAIAAVVVARSGSWLVALLINGLLVAVWLVFGRLTTVVDDERVTCRFGVFGRPMESFRLTDVVSVERVRTSPMAGWGMRWTTHGRLWNVWGLDAVELRLAGNRRFRIGTDEPDALLKALLEALRHARDTAPAPRLDADVGPAAPLRSAERDATDRRTADRV